VVSKYLASPLQDTDCVNSTYFLPKPESREQLELNSEKVICGSLICFHVWKWFQSKDPHYAVISSEKCDCHCKQFTTKSFVASSWL